VEDKLKQCLLKNTRLVGITGYKSIGLIIVRSVYPTLITVQYNNGTGRRHRHFISRLDCLELHIPLKQIPRRMIRYRTPKYHLFMSEWPQINHPAPICHTWYPSSYLLTWSSNLPQTSRI